MPLLRGPAAPSGGQAGGNWEGCSLEERAILFFFSKTGKIKIGATDGALTLLQPWCPGTVPERTRRNAEPSSWDCCRAA